MRTSAGPTAIAPAVSGSASITSSRSERLKPERMRASASAPRNVANADTSTADSRSGSADSAVTIANAIEYRPICTSVE